MSTLRHRTHTSLTIVAVLSACLATPIAGHAGTASVTGTLTMQLRGFSPVVVSSNPASVTVNGAGSVSFPISKLTVPGGVFTAFTSTAVASAIAGQVYRPNGCRTPGSGFPPGLPSCGPANTAAVTCILGYSGACTPTTQTPVPSIRLALSNGTAAFSTGGSCGPGAVTGTPLGASVYCANPSSELAGYGTLLGAAKLCLVQPFGSPCSSLATANWRPLVFTYVGTPLFTSTSYGPYVGPVQRWNAGWKAGKVSAYGALAGPPVLSGTYPYSFPISSPSRTNLKGYQTLTPLSNAVLVSMVSPIMIRLPAFPPAGADLPSYARMNLLIPCTSPGCPVSFCGDGNVDAGEGCDDGNTDNGDCCSATCQYEAASSPCEADANVCTDDICDGAGNCAFDEVNADACDDGNECTSTDTCAGGTCAGTNNTIACDDGLFCTQTDTCSGGSCIGSGDPCSSGGECADSCDEGADDCFDSDTTPCDSDDNVCTDDFCNGAGVCTNTNNTEACDDGNGCTSSDTCSGGTCSGTNNTDACDDGLFCTDTDTCSGGSCVGSGDPCSSGGECADSCDEGADNCFEPVTEPCTSDDNGCTDDFCNGAGACTNTNNADSCDDGLFCTDTDVCSGGLCVGSGDPCSSGGECADSCNESADNCFDSDSTACDSDDNACTDDFCNGAGVCTNTNNTAACDDGLFCTADDICDEGLCTDSGLNTCDGAEDGDGDCAETCDEGSNECVNDPNGSACDDGLYCTADDICDEGLCTDSGNNTCDGAEDGDSDCVETCDEGSNECVNDPAGSACDDGLFCTNGETCTDGTCGGGTDPCLAGVECADSCNEGADNCLVAANDPCGDAGTECTLQDKCDGSGSCTDNGFEAASTACGDSSDTECNAADTCDGAGACQDNYVAADTACTADANPCNFDSCDGAGACVAEEPVCTLTGEKSGLGIKEKGAKSQLKWKLSKGAAVDQAGLGDPQTTTAYTLCVYDETADVGSLATSLTIPADAVKWQNKDPKGLQYKDKGGTGDGVTKIKLKTGVGGKTKAQVQAKGANLPVLTAFSATEFFDQDTKVRVQLLNSANQTCWQSDFTTAKKNTDTLFKAKAP